MTVTCEEDIRGISISVIFSTTTHSPTHNSDKTDAFTMPLFRPFVPYHNSAGQTTIVKFGGLLTTEFLEPAPGRCFLFRQTYKHNLEGTAIPDNLRKLIDSPRKPGGPLLHFHQFQTEYFRVEQGIMGIEVNGVHKIVKPEDGEVSVKAGSIHRFYIHPDSPGDMTVYLSASDSGMDYQLDRIFFENWYGYWHDALLHEGKLNFIQYLAIQDGGDAYSVPPKWVPFRRFIGYWGSVALGRWLGGLLGYKPFFKEYTTDWDYAVAKMKGSWFQRHLVEESYTKARTWDEQLALDIGKPTNAEYEPWTVDLTLKQPFNDRVNGVNGKATTNGANSTGAHVNGNGVNGVNGHGANGVNGVKARKLAAAQ
ncbi:hypothetical protein B0T17DRAFT_512853 [Bombardia bombarda]|uniref:Uncharacterized protein n=1 Tax=Bombardia bombarda TaxID=252184 RepID=A0AA39XJM6_9PEZI|nr:hypothetical protein B0T17DRAFT_512853 [Bombardia bombarda]